MWKMALLIILFFNAFSIDLISLDIAAFPMFSYSDDTEYLFGVTSYSRFQFKDYPEKAEKQRLTLKTSYTTKKQFHTLLETKLVSPEGKYKFRPRIEYDYWPAEFYGIGNQNIDAELEKYTSKDILVEFEFTRKLSENWSFTALSEFHNSDIIDFSEDCSLVQENICGLDISQLFGLGAGITYDSRDSDVYSTSGHMLEYNIIGYKSMAEENLDHIKSEFTAKKFLAFSQNQNLALTSGYKFTSEDVPLMLPKLGSEVRGFPYDLFINKQSLFSRAEYRVFPFRSKLWKKLGFVAFFDVGEVFEEAEDLNLKNLRYSYGTGLRITVFPDDMFNLRIDFCVSDYGFSPVIIGGEAF